MEVPGAYMKRLYEEPIFYEQMVQRAKESIGEVLGKKRVVKMVEDRLDEISHKI